MTDQLTAYAANQLVFSNEPESYCVDKDVVKIDGLIRAAAERQERVIRINLDAYDDEAGEPLADHYKEQGFDASHFGSKLTIHWRERHGNSCDGFMG